MKTRIQISGMNCQGCASRIEKKLREQSFIQEANVNFANEEAQIIFDENQTTSEKLQTLIAEMGFKARVAAEFEPLESVPFDWSLLIILLINIPFLIGMLGMLIGHHDWMLMPALQFGLASVLQWWLAVPFYKSAWSSLKAKMANMDVLISLGTLSIYFYSTFTWIFGGHVYFEAAVMIIGFVSLGKFLELRTKRTGLNTLSSLIKLTPSTVNVLRDGDWKILPINEVQIGDLLRANQGERIAADGVITEGNAWFDVSHLTGESIPEALSVNEKILAGALVHSGSVIYRAEQLGQNTLLSDMMQALAEAQGSKAPIARIADKVAAVFVPSVISLAILTFFANGFILHDWKEALMRAVAVLVIACPCALGLATPAAIMVGMGKAAKAGIWFKDASSLEASAHINTVVLDKTGTLTLGKPQIIASKVLSNEINEMELYRLAAAVEQYANHPLAQQIVLKAKSFEMNIPNADEINHELGFGLSAVVENKRIKVGNAEFCGTENIADDETWRTATIVFVSVENKVVGAFAFSDTLKSDSVQAVQRLQKAAIDIHILSGDNAANAAHIAQSLEISQATGNMKPRDKVNKIKELQSEGKYVAMVGDGVNDAPALAAANVGFAMKNGADVAEQSAAVTLMQHSVNQLADALFISRATLSVIKQNLFFAIIYNILGIPLATCGLLNPIIAGAAMALSSISVISNALRLKGKKI